MFGTLLRSWIDKKSCMYVVPNARNSESSEFTQICAPCSTHTLPHSLFSNFNPGACNLSDGYYRVRLKCRSASVYPPTTRQVRGGQRRAAAALAKGAPAYAIEEEKRSTAVRFPPQSSSSSDVQPGTSCSENNSIRSKSEENASPSAYANR